MEDIRNLQPKDLWGHFYSLTQIPRPSGHLEKIQQFLLDFSKENGIEAFKDPAGNIVDIACPQHRVWKTARA